MSSVTHELRTPLTSIRALLRDLMLDDPDHGRRRSAQRFLGIVVDETERLTRLINQVLDLAKIESGDAEWRSVDGRPARRCCSKPCRATQRAVPRARRGRRAANCPTSCRRVRADPDRLDAGADQPAVERRQVRAAGPGRVELGLRADGRSRTHQRAGQRPRRAGRAPGAGVREVPPGRRSRAPSAGHRPGPAHQPPDRGAFRRPACGSSRRRGKAHASVFELPLRSESPEPEARP